MFSSIYPQTFYHCDHDKTERDITVKFPADVQVVVRSDRQHYGNLFIGNIEASYNTQLLQSIYKLTQILTSLPYLAQPKDTLLAIYLKQ